MVKDKRKTRLNKTQGTKTEFLGFSAFAADSGTPSSASTQQSLRWSPVYTGKDNHLATLVFPRLVKNKTNNQDNTTKVKALQELQDFFQQENSQKKQQVDALSHYMFLYHSKLTYDSSPSVRAEALSVLSFAAKRLPKAFSTLSQQNNQQILGMMYCCHGDPAAEVRAVAAKQFSNNHEIDAYSLTDVEAGLWSYAERILSYGRASKMQEDLFSSNYKATTGGAEEMNESQKDQLEERYERIVGTALGGIQFWIQHHGVMDEKSRSRESSSFLWKAFASPKSSLRNRTYILVATCCQKAPSIVFENQAFSSTLPQALASEKEAGNVSALLEALLAFLAAYSRYFTSSSPWDTCLNAGTVSKHLTKIFKKSCFGAPATQWGPSLLPLLAMLPSIDEQVSVLSSVWNGREQSVRMGDQWVVIRSVSESASFFLLRKQPDGTQYEAKKDVENSQKIAGIWVDCLKVFIGSETPKVSSRAGPVQEAKNALGRSLAKELLQFNEDRPGCLMGTIRDWFWNDAIPPCILEAEGNDEDLAFLLQEAFRLQTATSSDATPTPDNLPLGLLLKGKFHKVLSNFQGRSGAVPTEDAYLLMIAILRYCGVRILTNDQDASVKMTAEKFLMNDVLRWMVIHTSSLSEQKQTKTLAERDFVLFSICITGLPSKEARSKLWDTLLREIIAAKCRLDMLLAGLAALFKEDKTWKELVQCDILDDFAVQVVRNTQSMHIEGKEEDDSDGEGAEQDVSLGNFLQACAGLRPGIPPLVRPPVLSTWVDITCTDNGESANVSAPVLATFLGLSFPPSSLTMEEILRVIRQSWRQGGYVWQGESTRLLLKESKDLLPEFLDASAAELKATLVLWSSKADSMRAKDAAEVWSDRALRLVRLSRDAAIPGPSLKLVGFTDRSLWESKSGCDFVFSCLMRLLAKACTNQVERLELLLQLRNSEAPKFTVHILMALSEASEDFVAAAKVSQLQDRCGQLLVALGGKALGSRVLEEWLQDAIAFVAELIKSGNSSDIRRGVAVVSQLCCLAIDAARPVPVDVMSATDDNDEDLRDEFARDKLAKMIVPLVKKETLCSLPWDSSVAELVNVIVFRCGVGAERGLGSIHYAMFQLILAAERQVLEHLSGTGDAMANNVTQNIWLLSLCCGFGFNTAHHKWDPQLMSFEPERVTIAMLDYVEKQDRAGELSGLYNAVLSWLATASAAIKDSNLKSRAISVLYEISISIFTKKMTAGFCGDVLLALRGVHVAQRVGGGNVESMASQALMRVISGFLSWDNIQTEVGVIGQAFDENCNPKLSDEPEWRKLSHFNSIIDSALSQSPGSIVSSISDFTDTLVEAFFIPSKRWYAFRLLDAVAKSAQELGDPTPEEATARRFAQWTEDLDEEAKAEWTEDLEVVCEILPHRLMTILESWDEEGYTDTLDHDEIIGRMLAWLCCLTFVDAFVRKDPSTRPSLCAYIDKSGAAHFILNLTLLHGPGVGVEKGVVAPDADVEQLLRKESALNEVSLASMVLFRTVEAVPPMARRWWDEECPKVYTSSIREYIQDHISPSILEKELERLKYATIKNAALGDLTITGSVTTREITATYSQDEIKLRVLISLPPFYPLRNAEVDCSQTLGVPAKRWKLWQLQITMMLGDRGGTLQEALMLWKDNVDKEFDGVEPCPVCYSVLHIKTHKLPELECTTCSNRFHTQCLTQWFRSSGKSQCVLCQQPWAGTRVNKK